MIGKQFWMNMSVTQITMFLCVNWRNGQEIKVSERFWRFCQNSDISNTEFWHKLHFPLSEHITDATKHLKYMSEDGDQEAKKREIT